MLAIELIYVMEGFCEADSDDGWVTWVGIWGGAGKSTWISGTAVHHGGDDRGGDVGCVDLDDDGDD